uniref:Uncharacterized protein n=1 Tax=Phytophthora fragariae TaxID=53985 RepID=A0A6A3FW63_9STRA|nr:hypothetical protein PF009_g1759 [Phytophthora fragariae]
MKLFFAPIAAALTLLAAPVLAVEEEVKTLDELYADVIAEGGKLIFYHGGDLANQQDSLKAAFEEAFPGVNVTMVVDYSKYHDVRIDNQLETDTLVPDITALQTVQNFPRWAKAGDLLEYKPANFSKIYDGLKDKNGAWLATAGSGLPPWPTRASTANNLVTAQDKVIGVGTYAGAPPIVYVGGNGTEYLTWGQRLAILAKAKHPAAAKLFMNWIVSTEVQESVVLETVRTDIAPSGSSHPWEISEANLDAFPLFMSNRAQVEALKQTFALYFGEVQGEPTPGYLGVHPGL